MIEQKNNLQAAYGKFVRLRQLRKVHIKHSGAVDYIHSAVRKTT